MTTIRRYAGCVAGYGVYLVGVCGLIINLLLRADVTRWVGTIGVWCAVVAVLAGLALFAGRE